VTAVLRFKGHQCEIGFEDPLATENIEMNGKSFPLAADFTVPVAVMLASTKPEKLALARLLNPEKYAETARIARLQPYDPDKTVVLVVHGLNSTPATWTQMINTLRSNAVIRQQFQFWFYSYPSGYPYQYSAAILRRQLDDVQKRYQLRNQMVVIGHSMGGCISRLLITDVGDKLWMDYFGKPPSQVEMSEGTKTLLKESLIFGPRPEVGRVVFVAAPLKGADMAAGWMGRLGAKLVKAPLALAQAGSEVFQKVTFAGDGGSVNRMPNSVDTLSPNNRFVKAINSFPLSQTVPYHSIVGDRGRGGNKDKTKPVSSDGLVPYWSSFLPEAKSELIVPSGHGAHQHPDAINEMKRILLLHAKENH
jgi:pimeloyl-ACP methyl ester carboxylesterase